MEDMMKKFIAIAIALVMIFALAACGGAPKADGTDGIKIALVGHSPESILDDGSFNQFSWRGITKFVNDNGLNMNENARWFTAHSQDTEARLDVLSDAIDNWGANILILPGFDWANAMFVAQDLYPDSAFVILDAAPTSEDWEERIESNVAAIFFAEHESGFLAGYALVKDGYRNLGFIGGRAVPPVVRFGHGFIQGAEYAAAELALSGDIAINYHYWGAFIPSGEAATFAGSWYAAGTEIIFAAAGGVGFSVMSAAEGANAFVVGVDGDQSSDSTTVITSAMKLLDVSVNEMITDYVNGSFKGGRAHTFDASSNSVGLPMATSKFNNFTQAEYDAIFNKIKSGEVVVNDTLEMSDLTIVQVTVNEIS